MNIDIFEIKSGNKIGTDKDVTVTDKGYYLSVKANDPHSQRNRSLLKTHYRIEEVTE